MSKTEYAIRKTAVHLLRSGKTTTEVAQELNRSWVWVYKWRERFSPKVTGRLFRTSPVLRIIH